MAVIKSSTLDIRSEMDVVQIRQMTRQWCVEQGFTLVEQTKRRYR